jgi:hypothetical protein
MDSCEPCNTLGVPPDELLLESQPDRWAVRAPAAQEWVVGRWFILILGAAALVGAVICIPASTPPGRHFSPSAAQLQAASNNVWTTQNMPKECSAQNPSVNRGPIFTISRADAGTIFTVYSRDVVQVNSTFSGYSTAGGGLSPNLYDAQFSTGSPLCGLSSSDVRQWTCAAEGTGLATIYFPAPSLPTAMVEIAVIPGGPPSSTPGILLALLGIVLIVSFFLMGPLANRWRKVQDLRRADDAQR